MSSGLKEHAQSNGLWNGEGDFDFTKTYRGEEPSLTKDSPASQKPDHRYECGRKLMEKYAAGNATYCKTGKFCMIFRSDQKKISKLSKMP
jgi:hypothetical protein